MSSINNIILKINNISKSFEENDVLDDISINLKKGEIVSILGESGVGKSTIFNIISGIMKPDKGSIMFEDKDITNKTGVISYMLQKDLLFEYLTIIDNVCIPLIIRGYKKEDAYNKAKPLFKVFSIEDTWDKYPFELSGGMRQRAALLRTYLFSNKVVLLDEPFSALDSLTKERMHSWYLDIVEKTSLSTLFITHDIEEAVKLSDRIYLIKNKPAKVFKEYIIKLKDHDNLTDEFLSYKKQIINDIRC